ncbi:hypothetical protein Cni_G22343 [Canna indica]|uniref:Pentatricopeptide repeat-containing protein n=1 Tax=Canna indica TaxID=4628 RepID=A0AAQ3QL41_9LILI|nr:hypothetical protein Cni_G22343 [Canna indica]
MRWVAAANRAPSLLRRMGASSTLFSTSASVAPEANFAALSPTDDRDLDVCERVLTVLHTVPSFEPHLDFISPVLTAHIVDEVLADPLPAHIAFRFFCWASRQRHLRSWASHNRVISILRSPGGFDSAWRALEDLRQQGVTVPPAAFTALASAYSASGMAEKAVEAFGCMSEFGSQPNTFAFNTMLQIFVDKDVILLALAVYNQMIKLDCRPNRSTFCILMVGLCNARMSEDALALFDEMLQRGISPNTMIYTVSLSSLCKANRLHDAISLLESMKQNNKKPDSVTYHALLSGFCKSGKIDEAFEHLRGFEEDGLVLGLTGYSCLIDGLFKAGRFEEACQYYKEMLEKNVVPDCKLYTIMIKGFAESGKVEEAFSFLSDMSRRGLVPDTFCYNTLIKGLCNIGLLDRARSLILEISQNDSFLDSTTYTIMICGLCNEGLVNEAQKIFEEMEKHGCVPTVMTFNSLINGLCKSGRLEEANHLFCKMEMGNNPFLYLRLSQGANRIRDINSLRQLVEEKCVSGHVLQAYKLLRNIIDSGAVPDIVTCNILINGLCKAGNIDGAIKFFKEVHIKGYTPDAVTYGTLIDGLMKFHRDEEASMVLKHMLRSGCTASLSIYSIQMRTLCRKKKVPQAMALWLNYLSQVCKLPEEADALSVMQKQLYEGNLEEAIRGLVQMDQKRGVAGPFPYTLWLIGFCQVKKIDEAFKIFSILMESNIDATLPSCALLINYLCRDRKLELALDVMLYALDKGFIFMQPVGNRLIRKLCMHDKKDVAQELVRRMHLSGYHIDSYLRTTTKILLYNSTVIS